MILSLRQIKSRIRSIENVKKVTRAMEMVSVAKFRAVENKVSTLRKYYLKTEGILKNLLAQGQDGHPYLKKQLKSKKVCLCLISSDTGLCSSYNHNVISLADEFIDQHGRENVVLMVVGRKGFNYFGAKGMPVTQSFIGLNGRLSDEVAQRIFDNLASVFLSGQVSEVHLAYTAFVSAAKHKAVIEKFLNIDLPVETKIEYIFEPDAKSILEEMINVYLCNKLKMVILDAFASEHSARMMAMGIATNNAKELLEGLILRRNKVRQANITREIMEIISSAETLR